jgi:hypothetical protein
MVPPVTSSGRPLYLHLWYPTSAWWATQHLRYTWNNPVYNSNPGGWSTPVCRTFLHELLGKFVFSCCRGRRPTGAGQFPLLVATHGLKSPPPKTVPDTLETLASHGYIVASVEHTGDNDAFYQAFFLETFVGLALGPNPSIQSSILQRSRMPASSPTRSSGRGRSQSILRFQSRSTRTTLAFSRYSLGKPVSRR